MKEEIEVEVKNPKLFKVSDMADRTEYTFWQKANFQIADIKLNEGQKLQWFSEDEINKLQDIAFNFKPIILEFFKEKPYQN